MQAGRREKALRERARQRHLPAHRLERRERHAADVGVAAPSGPAQHGERVAQRHPPLGRLHGRAVGKEQRSDWMSGRRFRQRHDRLGVGHQRLVRQPVERSSLEKAVDAERLVAVEERHVGCGGHCQSFRARPRVAGERGEEGHGLLTA
eukprot:6669378-Prymnesium_polylepis.1